MSDDDGFVFGDEDESLFGSSDGTTNDSERRFGTSDRTDSSPTGRTPLGGTTKTVATVGLAVVLVVVAGAVAYPLVMDPLDDGPSEERAPGDGSAPAGRTASPAPGGPPVTQIVVTIEEPSGRTESTTRQTVVTSTTQAAAEPSTTERTTVPVNEFPAGDPADENETVET
jgi:hypothetical protein